jgi:enediyne biosynthesis protein E4
MFKTGAYKFGCFVILLTAAGCNGLSSHNAKQNSLFRQMEPDSTGIQFRNDITENERLNPIVYQYAYNGGGVAVGDVNGDGLDDIYFSANENDNRLYVNKGQFRFEDVTTSAGVQGHQGWKTGVTMADVNGDGKLDLYVCYSGNKPGAQRKNELFINEGAGKDGKPSFREEAAQFGLADSSFSTSAAFFDYDKDSDLDMILINHSPRKFGNMDDVSINKLMNTTDSLTGVKLFRNDNNVFSVVTTQAGIRNTRLNYGLGVSVADINNDGWPDIYLSNDFIAPDNLYINNKNGTFTDQLGNMLSQTSEFSMGNDVADINNDGLADIMTTDMLPEDNKRQKLLFADDNYELFDLRERTGLHAQYMRNMLHINNGDGTFSEAAQLAGISNTDWTWAPLFADYDNDGWKDLFVTNGFVHDYTNMDFEKYMMDYVREKRGNVQRSDLLEMVKHMPSSNMVNYIFKNDRGLRFTKANDAWGITQPSNSNGAAYADLDNDGDLDLVVNNLNDFAGVYQNDAHRLTGNNYLKVKLEGEKRNRFGVGAKVYLYSNGLMQSQENLMARGFQSSVSPVLHFGTGKVATVDSVHVLWNSGKEQWIKGQAANQVITVKESEAVKAAPAAVTDKPLLQAVSSPILFTHQEDAVNDFKRQPLLTASLSYSGPCMAKADVNGDGKEDVYIGGANGQVGKIFLQLGRNNFRPAAQPAFEADLQFEDVNAIFFDADGDNDQDLYVCSGGYDNFLPNDALLQDRIYLNDGKGIFTKSNDALPQMLTSTGSVTAGDINGDGAPDLFVGGRVIPGRYPEAPASYLLVNDGKARFSNQTQAIASSLASAGMFTDAVFADMNGDKKPDLITAGEWLPIQIWINTNGKLTDRTADYFSSKVYGWWNKLVVDDINGDGKMDIVAGNNGTNTQCKATAEQPAQLVYKDFDDNGAVDPILCFYNQGKSYPYVSRDELLDQLSIMRTRFADYKSYSNAQLKDIFSAEELNGATTLKATTLKTTCFISTPNGKYTEGSLPVQAQLSPVYTITLADINQDGEKDLLLAGNVSHTRIKMGRNLSNYGQVFLGDGKGGFSYLPQLVSGLNVKGDVRSVLLLNNVLLFGINNSAVQAYKITK